MKRDAYKVLFTLSCKEKLLEEGFPVSPLLHYLNFKSVLEIARTCSA